MSASHTNRMNSSMYIRAPGPRRLWCACRVCVTSVAKTPGVSLEEVARGKQQPQATMWRHQKIESEILQLEREAELTAAREAQRILQRKKEKKEKRDRKKEESEKESEASSDVEAGTRKRRSKVLDSSSDDEEHKAMPIEDDDTDEIEEEDMLIVNDGVPFNVANGHLPYFAPEPRRINPVFEQPAFNGHQFTLGQLLQDLMRVGVVNNWSNNSQEQLFKVIQTHFKGNLPSFGLALKMVRDRSNQRMLELPVCRHDCTVFNKHFGDYTILELAELRCTNPDCNALILGPRKELKKYYYVGLISALQELVENPATSELMLLPDIPEIRDPTVPVVNIWQSLGWHQHIVQGRGRTAEGTSFNTENTYFNRGRNIVLTMNVDGVVPHPKHSSATYTPVQGMILNLPENLRHKAGFMLLPAFIPGPNKPKSLLEYLRPLMQELDKAFEPGFEVMCPLLKKKVMVRVKLLTTNCDLPAHADNNEMQGHKATFGCLKCEIQGVSVSATMTFDGYKEFNEHGTKPPLRTHQRVMEAGAIAQHEREVNNSASHRAKWSKKTKGVTGISALSALPYFDMIKHTSIDMMHLTKGVIAEHLVKTLAGKKLVNNLEKEHARIRKRQAKEDEAATEHLEKQQAAYQIKRDAWSVSEKKKRKAQGNQFVPTAPPPIPTYEISLAKQKAKSKRPDRSAEMAEAVSAWHIPPKVQLALEQHCWSGILAPPGIAPLNKRPFTASGQLNTAQWVTFSKVTGKYLMSQYFEDEHLQALCNLFDFVDLCLAPTVTQQSIRNLHTMARILAGDIDKYFPVTERSMVLHLLVFHMPDEIALWGPTRGYWVFAFERMIGHYIRNIKSRKHPEKSIMNRVLHEQNLERQWSFDHREKEDDEDVIEEVDDDVYIVAPSTTNSLTPSDSVRWPKLTRNTSGVVFPLRGTSYARDYELGLVREKLGDFICQERGYKLGVPLKVRLIGSESAQVWVGVWKYSTSSREKKNPKLRTFRSRFAICLKDVPSLAATVRKRVEDGDPTCNVEVQFGRLVYGQFKRFYRLDVNGTIFDLAICDIFISKSEDGNPITMQSVLRIDEPLVRGEYIQLRNVLHPIGLGPVIAGLREGEECSVVKNRYVALHVHK